MPAPPRRHAVIPQGTAAAAPAATAPVSGSCPSSVGFLPPPGSEQMQFPRASSPCAPQQQQHPTQQCSDPVVCVPSSFFIGENGIPLEVVAGSVSAEELLKRITKVQQQFCATSDTWSSSQLDCSCADCSSSPGGRRGGQDMFVIISV
ncbi:hypothetical protein CRUP_037751 [Coryphaenoides rupestris]|nr:hypothetical protein CRUP_037751 [Coryphaenoides rupestris]